MEQGSDDGIDISDAQLRQSHGYTPAMFQVGFTRRSLLLTVGTHGKLQRVVQTRSIALIFLACEKILEKISPNRFDSLNHATYFQRTDCSRNRTYRPYGFSR